ncbi:unnamed protein product [Aspergillus niger]|uniref:Contig An11c0100, genomic contig n=1 Tax=Aspergillus niger (strain ATCC MYA-4892 / CBS 513.88 / FGSC A1513) TaxID=425011 RepID=A2QVV8_ASPNC|nr:unnamed protein product [Aspergillus niger]
MLWIKKHNTSKGISQGIWYESDE